MDAERRTTLHCYTDVHGWGWKHVDLFVHDAAGEELEWVHWQVPADGPDAADAVTARVEPGLRRTSGWRHSVGESGIDHWVADVEWVDA